MKKGLFLFAVFAIVLLLAACGNGAAEVSKDGTESLKLLENREVGKYLADSKGMTLYYFKKDESGKSNCAGECLDNWPPYMEKDFDVPEGFKKSDFGKIIREDTNSEQVTYKGYPLYYFVNDKQEGDVNGEGVKDIWYIVNSETAFQ